MTCRFAHDDGAYVLGALSPADRQEFERHLPGCVDCTQSVAELAGLPGLLGRVDASVVEQAEYDDPVPATLLPALSREVQRARRRRTWTSAGLAAAAAVAVIAAVTVWQVQDDETAAPAAPQASSSPADPSPTVEPLAMEPVGDVPVRATVTLEEVTWGTRLGLLCTYDTGSVEYELPPEVDYTLYVRTRDGRAERVGSWRSVDGKPMQLTAGTAATAEELESVEVRTADGRVVLRLAT
jgi:hypothetical protein